MAKKTNKDAPWSNMEKWGGGSWFPPAKKAPKGKKHEHTG